MSLWELLTGLLTILAVAPILRRHFLAQLYRLRLVLCSWVLFAVQQWQGLPPR